VLDTYKHTTTNARNHIYIPLINQKIKQNTKTPQKIEKEEPSNTEEAARSPKKTLRRTLPFQCFICRQQLSEIMMSQFRSVIHSSTYVLLYQIPSVSHLPRHISKLGKTHRHTQEGQQE
jgi:hypothetical protein